MNVYSIADGLPQNSILCLIQGGNGYLWFGTQSGLVRFDGVTPRIFNRWNTPELKNDAILSLYEEKTGYLWIGSDGGGLLRMKNGKWRSYTVTEGLSNNRIRVIFQDSRGNLWLGTDYGLNRMHEEKFTIYTTAQGLACNAINALCETCNGDLWIGGDSEDINLFKNEKFQSFKISNKAPVMEITAIHKTGTGGLWVGTEYGLYRFENGKSQLYRAANGTFAKSVRTIFGGSGVALQVGTYGHGLVQLKKNRYGSLTTENGFLDDFIHSVLEDHEGSLWIGTYTSGLVQLRSSRVMSLSRKNGLPENVLYTVCEDREGYLWAGTRDRGLCKLKGNRVEKIFSTREGLADNRVRALCPDKDGGLWIGTLNGLNRLNKGKFSFFSTAEGLSSGSVKAILQDSSGVLWVGTDRGLDRLENGTFKNCSSRTKLPDDRLNVNVLLEVSGAGLLVGTKTGLFIYKDAAFKSFPGVGSNIEAEVLSLYQDREKNLWIGTRGSGLFYFGKERLTALTTTVGLYNNYIFGILEDDTGNLWISSYRGVFRLRKTDAEQFADNKIKKVSCVFFDENDGMKSSECVSNGQPSACKTGSGQLLFPTVKGISIFDPAAIKTNTKPPAVVIEDVIVDNKIVGKDENKNTVIPAKTKMVEFYFTALSFKVPGRVKFKYKLEGFEDEWVETEPQQKRTAFYINLAPGQYCFRVTACNDDGIWNTTGATFNLKITSSFFRQPVFYLLIIVALMSAAGAVYRFLINRNRSKKTVEKYKTSALDADRAEKILPKLLELMEKEKIYLDADLTLKKLSERLMIHYNHLSQIINEKLQHSFNDFVNKYRIEEAKKKLADPREGKKTVLEIAYDTGFYSKSVFNTAFKKFTGMTPSEFKKKYLPD